MGAIGQFFATLWSPFGQVFHVIFYLPIYNILMVLYMAISHVPVISPIAYAIAIFILTVLIRLALFPLTRKQLQSSRAMQVLQPQLKELQQKHRENPQTLMAAQRELYREHGVNPYSGCLPLVIQMPFLYGLYYSLYTVLLPHNIGKTPETIASHLHRVNMDLYPFVPHLAHLPNDTFFWTHLGLHDPLYILPVLAALFTFFQLRMAQPVKKPTPPGQRADANTQAMSSMQFVMPFITFFMALNFPSGLAFYWTISTAFSGVQQYFLTGFGSLFVGIPGLEHLVPAPQQPPTLPSRSVSEVKSSTTTTGGARSRGIFRDDPALSSALVANDRPTGLGGLRDLLRQLVAPPAKGPDQDAVDLPPTAADGGGTNGAFAKNTYWSDTTGANAGASTGGARRPARAPRTGPMLVKPPSADDGAVNGMGANGIDATGDGANANGANGSSAKENGTRAASDGMTRDAGASSPYGTTPRRPGGGSGSRNGQGQRRRPGGRPKGGR
ncbi:MAG TPA: membrane protein insertase YidC [Ktedonobacterales bacterium]